MKSCTDARVLEGARILVVDDEFMIASSVSYLLGDAGASVAVTTTLPDALKAASTENLSAALLDIRLGRGTSEPVADVLARRGVPFLFFSGMGVPDALREKFPAVRALPKPMGFHALLSAIVALLPAHVA